MMKRRGKRQVYTIIGILIPCGPLALSFDQKVFFIQYLIPVMGAAVTAGAVYIVWDVFAVKRNHWAFNPELAGGVRIARLPLGEWLFFLGVPYACLFIYEVVLAYFGSRQLTDGGWAVPAVSGGLALGAFAAGFLAGLVQKREYTSWVSISAGAVILLITLFRRELWTASAFWIYLGLCMLAFLVVNGTYVNLPTIFYTRRHFSGIRILGIPLEDFLYNFSYLSLVLFSYLAFKKIPGILLGPGGG